MTGIRAQLATPTETSSTSIPVEIPEVIWPQSVSPVKMPTAITTHAVMTRPGRRQSSPPTGCSCAAVNEPFCATASTLSSLRRPAPGTTPTKVDVAVTFVGQGTDSHPMPGASLITDDADMTICIRATCGPTSPPARQRRRAGSLA